MNYKIYQLVGKSKTVPDGYYMSTVITYKLKEIYELDMKNDYASVDDAYDEIRKNKDKFESKVLTILPIIELDYHGSIINPTE